MHAFIARIVSIIILLFSISTLNAADQSNRERADGLLREKQYREAARHYDLALKENSSDIGIIVSYGWCLFLDGRLGRAVEITAKGLDIEPRNPYVLGNLALYHLAGGDSKAGTSYYDRLFDLKLPAVRYCSILKGDIDDNPGSLPAEVRDAIRKEFTGRATKLYPGFGGIYADYLGLAASDAAAKEAHGKKDHSAAAAAYARSAALGAKVYGGKHAETALRHYMSGISHSRNGKPDAAIDSLRKALAIYVALSGEESIDAANTCRELGYAFYQKNDLDAAIAFFEKSLVPHKKSKVPDNFDIAERYHMLGIMHYWKKDYDKANECYNSSLAIYEKTPDKTREIRGILNSNLGQSLREKGDMKNAIVHFKAAIALIGEPNNKNYTNVVHAHRLAGVTSFQSGDCGAAISHLQAAFQIQNTYAQNDAEKLFYILYDTGIAHWIGGDVDKAVDSIENSLHYAEKISANKGKLEAEARSSLGFFQVFKGDYKGALENTLKAMETFTKIHGENHVTVYNSYTNLCNIYQKKKDYRESIKYGKKALDLAKALKITEVSLPCILLAFSHSHTGEHSQAIEMSDRAFNSSHLSGVLQHMITIPKECGYVALAAKDNARALRYFGESVDLIEQYRVQSSGNDLKTLSANIISYYFLFKINAMMGDMKAAFHTAERMRARMFLDRLSLNSALNDRGISPADCTKILALHDRIKSLSLHLASLSSTSRSGDQASLTGIRAEKEKLENEFNALDDRLMKNDRYRALRKPRFASLADARALCGTRGAILEFLIHDIRDPKVKEFERGLRFCMVITAKGVEVVTLDPDYDYTGTVMKFREAVIQGRTVETVELSRSLYRALFSPLEKKLAGVIELTIVPDGVLAFLPFDALRVTGAGGKPEGAYLCERYSLTLSPSVSVSMAVRARSFPAGRSPFLAFGGCLYSPSGSSATRGRRSGIVMKNPGAGTMDSGGDYYASLKLAWDDLPGCEDEVREIARDVFGVAGTRVVSGKDASESRVKTFSGNGTLTGYRNVHFALHGYYDQENPSSSAIVFSEVSGMAKGPEDGYLSVEEVTSLNLAADMVNLSACETGLGKAVRGDGVVGLTRAFQIAGANRVGVTLWQVDDEATKEFMVSVYRKIEKEKKSHRQAYRETRHEFIRSKKYSSPYFWSPFVLYGE